MAQLTGKHGNRYRLRFTRNFKRAAASAASRNIRISDLKAGTAQSVQKINCRTREIVCAIDVDQYLDTILFDPLISLLRLVELHPILHPGATPCLNKDPKPFIAVLGVFRDKLVQSSKGRVCHIDHCVLPIKRHPGKKSTSRQGAFVVTRSFFLFRSQTSLYCWEWGELRFYRMK